MLSGNAQQNAGAGASSASVLLRVRTRNFMARGPDISCFSTFPAEEEYLFPPLTFFKPCSGQREKVNYDGTEFTIVEVTPNFPS